MFTQLFLISFVFIADSVETGNTLYQQNKVQLEHFVQQYEKNENPSLYGWGIYEIAASSCKMLHHVQSRTQNIKQLYRYYQRYDCNSLDSLRSDHNYISTWSKDVRALYQKIITSELPISDYGLDFRSHPIIHFHLLMDKDYSSYYSKELLSEALAIWQRIEKNIPRENRSSLLYSIYISNIIRSAYHLDRYDIIENYFQPFLELVRLPNSFSKLEILSGLDYSFYVLGKYDLSLKVQRNHSIPLAKFLNSQKIYSLKNRQGAYLYALGKYSESLKVYESLYNDSYNIEEQYSLFTNLSINYIKLGHSSKYISFQLRALEQEIKNYKSLLNIYRNLFVYYTRIHDLKTAVEYIDRAKQVAKSNNDSLELGLIDLYLGYFYWSKYNDHKKALEHLNASQQILSSENDYREFANLLTEKATIYQRIDSLSKSRNIFEIVRELSLSKSDTPKYLDALINLADISLKEENVSEAREYLDEIKLYSLDVLDFQLLTKFYTVKSKYLYNTGAPREAVSEMEPVIQQIVDRSKSNVDSQEGYWSVEDEYLDAFEFMVDLLMETGEDGKALLILDQLKTINDASLYNSPLVKATKLTEEELAEEKRLNNQLQRLRKKYLNADEDERFSIKANIDQISAEREQILAKANIKKDASLPPLWKIQRGLGVDEVLLHFTELGTNFYVSTLSRDGIHLQKFDFPLELQQQFSKTGDELASGKTNLHNLYEIYQELPLENLPKNTRQVSVIPDEFLYRIPLEVLPYQKPASRFSFGSSRYMVEKYLFGYYTSLQEFEKNRRSSANNTLSDFTAFAISDFSDFKNSTLPSLPYATTETNNIADILTDFDEKKIFTGNEANKEAFKQNVSSSRIVHVATHSEVSEQDPLFSTIYLKSASGDSLESDQALYAYELFDTPLQSELIMLNSCSSGSGNYMQGTGIMGITRALRYAGAKSLALNLWSVNDKVASEFATDFYASLNAGATKGEAIRSAKINQLRKANANPHFWGAYMLIGNPAPVNSSRNNAYFLYSILGITIGLAGYKSYRGASV